VVCCLTSNKQLRREQVTCHWDDDGVLVVPDHHAYLDCNGVRHLKQQSSGRPDTSLGHITQIPIQLAFVIIPKCWIQ